MSATIRAWLVHAYTALGLVCAAAMAALIVIGGDDAFRAVFVLMVAATVIDATDELAGPPRARERGAARVRRSSAG